MFIYISSSTFGWIQQTYTFMFMKPLEWIRFVIAPILLDDDGRNTKNIKHQLVPLNTFIIYAIWSSA